KSARLQGGGQGAATGGGMVGEDASDMSTGDRVSGVRNDGPSAGKSAPRLGRRPAARAGRASPARRQRRCDSAPPSRTCPGRGAAARREQARGGARRRPAGQSG